MTGVAHATGRRLLLIGLLLALAAGLRVLTAVRTVAPDRDCTNYLQITEAIERGDAEAALDSVFPPLHPAWLSVFTRFAADGPEPRWQAAIAATLVLELLTLLLLVRLGERHLPASPLRYLPAFWFATSMLAAWQVADGMSEPLFRALFAAWLLGYGSGRTGTVLLLPALLFWTRPEGAVLFLPAILHAWQRRTATAWTLLGAGLLLALLYPVTRAWATGHFALLPKAAFMAPLSAAGTESWTGAVAHYGRELARFCGQGFDGVGYLAFPLLLLGAARSWRDPCLRWPVIATVIALLVVPAVFANRRFWTPWLPLLLLIAAGRLPWPTGLARRRLLLAMVCLTTLPHTVRLGRERREELRADLAFARVLRADDRKPDTVASDLPRFLYFAGQAAPPPRSIDAPELRVWLRRERTRVFVTLERRQKVDARFLRSLGYRPLSLPPKVAKWNVRRGLTVWIR